MNLPQPGNAPDQAVPEMLPAETMEFEALNDARNYRRAIVAEFQPYLAGEVAEIGAGVGQVTQDLLAMTPRLRHLTVVEPDPVHFDCLRRSVVGPELIRGTVSDIRLRHFDSIVSINVLEHIADDQAEMADYGRMLLSRGGHLCIFVPAGPELYADMDRRFGHYRRYTKADLSSKLQRSGFKLLHVRHFNLPGYFLWWLEFCVIKQRHFSIRKVHLFDRIIFPVINYCETRLCAPPCGQSIIAVAKAVAEPSKGAMTS